MIKFRNPKSRRRFTVVATITALLLGGIAAFDASPPLRAAGVAKLAEMGNALAMLAARSPGERTIAMLSKSKGRKLAAATEEQAAPKEVSEDAPKRSRVIEGAGNNPADVLAVPDTALADPSMGDAVGKNPASGDETEIAGIPGSSLPGYVFDYPNPGGGFGGGGPIIDPPTEPPISGVPEPETWMFMMIGMGLIGWAMRRRPKAVKTEQRCGYSTH